MNLTLVSTFIIGTMLLLAIVKINLNLAENSMDSMSDQQAKMQVDVIAGVVGYDLRKMGYRVEADNIVEATPTKLTFRGDLEDNGSIDEISWEVHQTTEVTETPNPNDFLVTRTVNGDVTPIKLGVVKFEFSYYNAGMEPTSVLDEIRSVRVKVVTESTQPIAGKYMSAAWEKVFTPSNI